jgi:hypothetical protein
MTILSSTVKNNFPFFFLPDTPFQALDLVDLINKKVFFSFVCCFHREQFCISFVPIFFTNGTKINT